MSQRENHGGGLAIAQTKAAQEVQAAMVVAKQFPRSEVEAMRRIEQACKRTKLAEQAVYAYLKGGTNVTGPSIRMAEMLAQNWGNVDFGIIELEQRDGESVVMSYAWDLETNTRQTKVFTVKHERKARGSIDRLTDPRDIYEMVANQGARRLRACILGIIPGDVQEMAQEECRKTLEGSNDEPLVKRIKRMADAFEEYGVTKDMLQTRLGHNLDATTVHELIGLRNIFQSLKDGMSAVQDWFAKPLADTNGKRQGFGFTQDTTSPSVSVPEAGNNTEGQAPAQEQAKEGQPAPTTREEGDEPGLYTCTACGWTGDKTARGGKCPACKAPPEKVVATDDLKEDPNAFDTPPTTEEVKAAIGEKMLSRCVNPKCGAQFPKTADAMKSEGPCPACGSRLGFQGI